MHEKQLRGVFEKIGILNQFSNNVQVYFGETRYMFLISKNEKNSSGGVLFC